MGRADKSVNNAMANIGRDIGDYIRQQRSSAQISLRQLAKLAGVSNPYLSQIERGLRKPSAEILQQIARGLHISAEVLYVQAGILDQRPGGPVVDAVLADSDLSDRQKQVLLDVYESFRRENTAAAAHDATAKNDGKSTVDTGDRVAPQRDSSDASAGHDSPEPDEDPAPGPH